ncbi:hypothetical protein GOV09_05470 [Candidatus Woesearchaeota archaeon]|nr:hypothetical protein [Candidatus Woesearchaeota archaeon]
MAGTGKRTFKQLQKLILRSLKARPLTINEISSKSRVNWNSTAKQLILLKGHELVKEIISHRRLRVFELTKKGRKLL